MRFKTINMKKIVILTLNLFFVAVLSAQTNYSEFELLEECASGAIPSKMDDINKIFVEEKKLYDNSEKNDSENFINQTKYTGSADVQDSLNVLAFLKAIRVNESWYYT